MTLSIEESRAQYVVARAAKVGEVTHCPVCLMALTKINYQQVFCSNSGPGNCKDHYWNLIAHRLPTPVCKNKMRDQMLRALMRARPLMVAVIQEDKAQAEPTPGRADQVQELLRLLEEVINDPK